MKRNGFFKLSCVFLLVFLLCLTACGGPDGEETLEEGELTPEYLKNDYTSQLLTDGAEHLVGSIELSAAADGSPQIILHPKEVSNTANADGTYDVSSYAINRVLSVSDSLYAIFTDGVEILSADQFLAAVQADYDSNDIIFDEYGDHILYDVYALEDQALLILYNPAYVLPVPEAK